MAKLTLLQHLESVALTAKQFSVGLAAELTQAVLDAVSELNETKADKITGKQGQIVGFNADGQLVAQDAPETGVTSFKGRKGEVVPQSGDYTAAQVGARPNTWTPTASDVGAAPASHGTHVSYSATAPKMDGTAAVGTAGTVARSDHVHPTDTSRAPASHTHSYLPLSGGTLTGNLTLKGSGNYGTKINLGDGDYVHIAEPSDDCLEIKAKKLDFVLSDTTSGSLTVNGTALLTAIGAAAAGHTHNYAPASHTHTKSQISDFPASLPASDVYDWAKAASKPTYTASEVGAAAASHTHTAAQAGLGNVPNVSTNNQTPTYTQASALTALSSGEKLSVAFGKIAKAVADLIAHITNKSNPHGVTAAQVGARPSTWTPTASDVGAAAADHTHTAADVGAAAANHTHNYASSSHTHTAADVGAAAASHGTHVSYSTTAPKADGTAAAGTAGTVARSDHVHPTDTSRAPVSHTHSKSQITDFPTSLPASDVYSWAKAASKPAYTASEVGAAQKPLSGSITIPKTGWSSDSTATYSKYYDVAVTGVTASDRAHVDIAAAAWAAAIACGLCPVTETLAGKIRIRAASVPAATISANYFVEKGA